MQPIRSAASKTGPDAPTEEALVAGARSHDEQAARELIRRLNPRLFRIARKTRRVAAENIVFALAVKAGVMALGVAGLSGLWEAVFADVGVALLAVLNSMRMTRV